ncbi:MAG: hybrid sensor histidine kinase/response regulator [Nannocystaceae bacterium]
MSINLSESTSPPGYGSIGGAMERWMPRGDTVRLMMALATIGVITALSVHANERTPNTEILAGVISVVLLSGRMWHITPWSEAARNAWQLTTMVASISALGLMIPALGLGLLPWIFAILVGAAFKLPPLFALLFAIPAAGSASFLLALSSGSPTSFTLTAWNPPFWVIITSNICAALTSTWVGAVNIRRTRSQEAALERSEEGFRKLIDRLAVGMFILRDRTLIDLNAKALMLLGAKHPSQVIGLTTDDLFDEKHQDISSTSSITLRGLEEKETRLKTLDDVERVVELSTMNVSWNDESATLLAAFDLTERKWAEAERDQLQAQIRHAQKLETIGLLAGGIAHDFNNILQAILANTELMLSQGHIEQRLEDRLHRVAIAAQRGASLVSKMLAYAGRGQNELTSVNLSELANDVIDLARPAIPKRIHIKRRLQDDLPSVAGDEGQLQQVIMNLVTNASDAMSEIGGELVIRSGVVRADAEMLMRTYLGDTREPGLYVFVEVADSGRGINPAELSRIFDPFFTTKERGRGLGLASSIGIVNAHHGAMEVNSVPGEGTRFRFLLPPEDVPQPRSNRRAYTSGPRPIGKNILVADDEKEVLESTKIALRAAGFEVVTATNGAEALEHFREDPRHYSAVVLDLAMPVMDGAVTLKKMREIDPETYIVLSTGYTYEYEDQDLDSLGFSRILRKPFPIKELVRVLKEKPVNE